MSPEAQLDGPINYDVVQRHVDEAAMLHDIRAAIVTRTSIALRDLRRLDDRLLAHLDGISVAGDKGWQLCRAAADAPSAGVLFTATTRALERGDHSGLNELLALADTSADSARGVISALGWREPQYLRGIVANLLTADDVSRRMLGVSACAVHRVDPGARLGPWIEEKIPGARVVALRTAGEIGRLDLMSACLDAARDQDVETQAWGGWAAVLLGNRGAALEALANAVRASDSGPIEAFHLLLQAMSTSAAHGLLQEFADTPERVRWLIQGSGFVGDPTYVPWLLSHIVNERHARVAGEALSVITGVDVSRLNLERSRPENYDGGPNDDPDDANVAIDADEGLPWPDHQKVEYWWAANAGKFQRGRRYFMGAPVTREHCIHVLKTGYQRQRILAAHYLCLLEPGTPLFNTSAPAWRQQRLLATM